jgi:integrase/recombinase XerD
MQLHTIDGARKYLTPGERDGFLREAERADRTVRTLCMTLAYAGCRLSEALALTVDRVDLAAIVTANGVDADDAET